jgi:hypothetical protein
MVPQINIRFSFIYNKKFNPDFSYQEFIQLKENSKPFLDLIKNNIEKILELISFHNEPWLRNYIPIYIISAKIKSFSDPLTLRYRDDHKLLLLILIHELIHNNLTKKYKDSNELHREVNIIYEKVIKDLNLKDFKEAIEKYRLFS